MNSHDRREIRAMQAQLRAANRKYGALPVQIPSEQWPPTQHGTMRAVWRSNRFLVQVVQESEHALRMSVSRTALADNGRWVDGITWDELQELKGQIGYADHWMVELYPPTADTVNVANIRHLWLLPEPPAFGWH